MLKFILPTTELFYQNCTRCFSQTALLANEKSNLFKLRKSTGYALSKCKDALEKHNGNVEEVFNEQIIGFLLLFTNSNQYKGI